MNLDDTCPHIKCVTGRVFLHRNISNWFLKSATEWIRRISPWEMQTNCGNSIRIRNGALCEEWVHPRTKTVIKRLTGTFWIRCNVYTIDTARLEPGEDAAWKLLVSSSLPLLVYRHLNNIRKETVVADDGSNYYGRRPQS